jgi:Tol biopolymer transport system component
MQLTSLGSPFYSEHPHWSPDGRLILFTSSPKGHPDTYVVGSNGGTPNLLLANFTVDSWSRDGKWLYFLRPGPDYVWKRAWPLSGQGGDAIQVTPKGGYFARESPDGRTLYYLKNDQELWKMPVNGGKETQVLGSRCCRDFAVVKQGIYFLSGWRPSGNPSIEYLSFATGRATTIAKLGDRAWWGFSVSPDGRSLLYAQQQPRSGDLWMVENFR